MTLTYNDVVKTADTHLLPVISRLYMLEGYKIDHIERDYIPRNVVYKCEKEGADSKILRISFINDRSQNDYLSEVEYIRYLFEHGGSVSNVVNSQKGNMVEKINHNGHTFFICLFAKAKGKMIVENNYQYREGVPLTEYFYNCSKVLGKLHQLSKDYNPIHCGATIANQQFSDVRRVMFDPAGHPFCLCQMKSVIESEHFGLL